MRMNGWAPVLLGGVFETGWSATMRMSDGFTDPVFDVLTLLLLFISTWLLNMGLKTGLPVGASYAVWVGVGALGSIIVGLAVFGEAIGYEGFVCLGMILAGVVGMNIVSGGEDKA